MQPLKKSTSFSSVRLKRLRPSEPFGPASNCALMLTALMSSWPSFDAVLAQIWPSLGPEEPQAPYRDRRRQGDDWCFARAEAIGWRVSGWSVA